MQIVVLPDGASKSTSILGIKGLHLSDILSMGAHYAIGLPDLSAVYKSNKDDGLSAQEAAAAAIANLTNQSWESMRAKLHAGGNDSRSWIERLAAEFEGGALNSADAASVAFDEADKASKDPSYTWLLIGGIGLLWWLFGKKRGRRGIL